MNEEQQFDPSLIGLDPDQPTSGREQLMRLAPWVAGAAGIVVVGVLLFLWLTAGLSFTIQYDDGAGLSAGSPVVHRGLPIGKVTRISIPDTGGMLDVRVKIQPEYADLVRTGSTFLLEDSGGGGSLAGRHIVMEVWVPTSPAVPRGATVQGASNYAEYLQQVAELKGNDFLQNSFAIGTLDVVTIVLDDGQVLQRLRLECGRLIPAELLFASILPSGEGWQRQDTETGTYKQVSASGTFIDPQKASWANSEIILTRATNLLWTDLEYVQSFSPGAFQAEIDLGDEVDAPTLEEMGTQIMQCVQDPENCPLLDVGLDLGKLVLSALADQLSAATVYPLGRVAVNITLEMPGVVVETNATSRSGNTLVWSVAGAGLNEGYTLSVKSRSYHLLPLVIAAAFVVVIVGGIAYRQTRKRRPVEQEDTQSLF